MSQILKQIESLYENELFSNVVKISELFLSSLNPKTDAVLRLQVAYIHADSLYKIWEYQQAQYWFQHCLQLRKGITKLKNNKIQDKPNIPSEVDIKYNLHLCYVALKKFDAALDVLQHINTRQRNAKVNMALGNLLRDSGMERTAVVHYKAVLEENPYAVDAADNLLKIGINGADISSLTLEATGENNMLYLWLKSQAQFYGGDFRNAIRMYKSMDTSGLLKENVPLLINLANCYVYICDYKKAIDILKKVTKLDSSNRGLDLLATLLSYSDDPGDRDYLESLIPNENELSLFTGEQWIVLGNFMLTIKNYERALYFGHQSMFIKKRTANLEALLLKARAFYEIGKFQEVIDHCTEAIEICPFRFDIHKCLVETYVKMNRLREAEVMALNACHKLHNLPQALVLQAKVLFKDNTNNVKNIKKILDKAIALDRESSTEAVIMLADVLENEQQYEQAKQMLIKQIENCPSSQLHQLLGECYINLQEDEEAFNHFNIALKLDPGNQKAIEGLNLIGPLANPLTKRDSYYSCVGETSQSTSAQDYEIDAESEPEIWRMNRNNESPTF